MDFTSQLADPLEKWLYGLFLAGVSGIAFSIAVGQTFFGLSLLALILIYVRGRVHVQFPILLVPALLFGVIAGTTAYYGIGEDIAADGTSTPIGIKPAKELLWLLVMVISATVITSTDRLRSVMHAFSAGCGILSLDIVIGNPIRAWYLYKSEGPGSHNPQGVPEFYQSLLHQGSMTDGQMLMLGLLVAFGLFILARKEQTVSIGWALLFLLELTAFVINYKRGSWICAVMIIGLFMLLKTNWRYILGLLTLLGALSLVPAVQTRVLDLKTELSQPDKGGRIYMWQVVYPEMIKTYPQGVGYGHITPELMAAAGPKVEANRNHLHSNPLTIRAETGKIGLFTYAAFMIWGVALSWAMYLRARTQSYAREICSLLLTLMLLGLIANGMVEYNYGDSEILLIYGIIFGIVGSRVPLSDAGADTRVTRYELS